MCSVQLAVDRRLHSGSEESKSRVGTRLAHSTEQRVQAVTEHDTGAQARTNAAHRAFVLAHLERSASLGVRWPVRGGVSSLGRKLKSQTERFQRLSHRLSTH